MKTPAPKYKISLVSAFRKFKRSKLLKVSYGVTLFGYSLPMEPRKTHCYNEQFLREAFGLPLIGHTATTALNECSDVIFVYIDFENGTQIKSHAGSGIMGKEEASSSWVSIFDTKMLSSPSPQEELRTYNIGLGGSPSNKRHIDAKFWFGETNWICRLADLLDSIENLIDRTRNIVLVSHGFVTDLCVLQALGFDTKTSIVGTLDTELLARGIFGLPHAQGGIGFGNGGGLRLGNVLAKLKYPVEGCHIAGNDANFTLRALLLLAAECYSGLEDSMNNNERERLERIKAIGNSPLPRLSPPRAKPLF